MAVEIDVTALWNVNVRDGSQYIHNLYSKSLFNFSVGHSNLNLVFSCNSNLLWH